MPISWNYKEITHLFIYYCVLFLLCTCPIVLLFFCYMFLIEHLLFLVATTLLLPKKNNLCISVKAFYFYHCLCLLYKVLLLKLCLMMFLYCLYYWLFAIEDSKILFTESLWSSSSWHWSGSYSRSWTVPFLQLLQTFLK